VSLPLLIIFYPTIWSTTMKNLTEDPTPVIRHLIPEDKRLAVTAELFGAHFPLRLEPVIYGVTERMAQDYHGGYWQFYTLDNGGFYMAPDDDRVFAVSCDNYFTGELSVDTRPVALYPCVGFSGESSIFPQVLERRSSERNSQETSLEEVLRIAYGNWVRLWYDEETGNFQCQHTERDPAEILEYPGFVWDCLNAIGECFGDEPEHPLQALIQEQQQLYM
jgi:hypothetical protein